MGDVSKGIPRQSTVTASVLGIIAFAGYVAAAEPEQLSIAHDEYIYMIRFSPDGSTLATAAGDNVARVWEWPTQELLHTLKHDAAVYTAVFSPAKDLLATGSGDGNVSLWRTSTGQLVARQQQHADAVYCLSFAPDAGELASIGGDGKKGDTQCRIWSMPALEVARVLPGHERPAYGVLFSPRSSKTRVLVTSGGDKLIQVYDRNSNKRLTLQGHTSDVYRCCFSPDGTLLASTSQDHTIRLWDVTSGQELKTLFKANDPTYDVDWSSDGRLLAAVADDGFVRFWSTETWELLLESKVDNEGLYSVVFTPDQTSVLTAGVGGRVYVCPTPKLASNE